HVTHSGNRPMHFACSVAMSARLGMDLDLAKLSPQDKAICAGAISAYNRIREVTQLGDLYRLERPHDAPRGALNFVSPDRSHAVVFVFQLRDGEVLPVPPKAWAREKKYTILKLNPLRGRSRLSLEGRSATGEALMRKGIIPSCSK